MTKPARILQDDMDRAIKAIARANLRCERIIMDLAAQRIEIIMDDSGAPPAVPPEWSDDD